MTTRGAPRVSVVMAVYNGERYLADALESILAQDMEDFELILVDDGSTDGSSAIARRYQDERIRLLSNETNLGLARTLNRGIAAARGEFVARLDADDVAEPERLTRQVDFLDANPDVALLGSWYLELGEDGGLTKRRLPIEHWDLRWHLCLYCPFVHSAMTWRRTLVAERVGHYDESLAYSMDYDLWHRIASALVVANEPDYLVRLRTHQESMTATFGSRAREGKHMRAERAAALLGWPTENAEENAERLQRLYRLHVGTPRHPLGRRWLRDARELMRLHAAFVATEGMPPRVAARQRRAIVAGLLRRAWQGLAATVSIRPRGR